MKLLRIGFVGLILFSMLESCSLRPSHLFNQSTPTFITDISTPTFTLEPTLTLIPSLTRRATFTPIPSSTRGPSVTPYPSNTPIPEDVLKQIQAQVTQSRFLTGGGTPFQCKFLTSEPEQLEVLRPKKEFAGIFRILNNGKTQWSPTDIAYFHISGWKFQTGKYKEDFIPYVVNPKEEVRLQVPMRAPADPGVYFAIWGLRSKSLKRFFCTFALTIVVEEKK